MKTTYNAEKKTYTVEITAEQYEIFETILIELEEAGDERIKKLS